MKFAVALCVFVTFSFYGQAQFNFARRGILDLRLWDADKHGYAELNGEWELYMSELWSPEELSSKSVHIKDYVNFPATWNDRVMSGNGYATYHLRVVLAKPQRLAIELPHFYSNYKLWINGTPVAANGTVGKSRALSSPQWLPQTVNFEAQNDTLDVVVHVSNFHHAKGGIRENVRLGSVKALQTKRTISVTGNVLLCGGLMVIAFVFTAVFFFKGETSAIFFAALCFTWAVRQAFSNLYIFTAAYPDFPWETAVKIEYVTLYLTMAFAVLFISSVFPEDTSNIFKYLFVVCNITFTLFTIITEASTYTQFLPVYMAIAAILLVYILYVLIRATVYERPAVWFIVGCLALGVIFFAYDLVAYEGFIRYNSVITHIAYFLMFILLATSLFVRYGFIRRTAGRRDILTYDDLYGSRK